MKQSKIELTKAEEQIMHVLWELEKAFVKEIVEQLPSPKPAYNTVSTIIRILEQKGIIGHHAFGRTHQYYPLVSKDEYLKQSTHSMLHKFFGGSMEKMLSYFVEDKQVSIEELEEIIKEIKST